MHLMAKRPLSLRKHLIWILLVKLVVILLLRVTFFPRLQDQHLPEDLYPSAVSSAISKESS
jgi:hypothetical protein